MQNKIANDKFSSNKIDVCIDVTNYLILLGVEK